MTLPQSVVEKDQKLLDRFERTANELMELRWHWTLDKSNPDRVSMSEYARQVGAGRQTVQQDANGWAEFLAANERNGAAAPKVPGQATTPGDFRELAKMGEERKQAVESLAKHTGKSVENIARHKRQEVDAVLNSARARAERKAETGKPTTVESEIDKAAQQRVRAEKAAQAEKDEKKRKHTQRFMEIEANIGAAMQKLRKVLNDAEDDGFTADERELITDSLRKLRALLGLIDLRITGETDVDWDAEFQKITK